MSKEGALNEKEERGTQREKERKERERGREGEGGERERYIASIAGDSVLDAEILQVGIE